MTEIGVQFSIADAPLQLATKPTMARRRKSPMRATPGNLFNHPQRSQQMQYSAVLPIISLSSLSDLKEKFTRMASNNKTIKQPTRQSPVPTEFRLKLPTSDMPQTKSRLSSSNRSVASSMPKSSLSYPTTLQRPTTPHHSNYQQQHQQGARFLYLVNTPVFPRRAASARITHVTNNNLNPLPLHQQPHLLSSPLLPRPHPQYGHFLAYLRRQSLARLRRKQQQHEEGFTDGVETTVTFSPTRPTPPVFHSISNISFGASSPETVSMPTISLQSKRKPRPLSSYRLIPRSSQSSVLTNYRLNLNQTPPLKPPPPSPRILTKTPVNDQPVPINHAPMLLTPTNSVVEEATMSPSKKAPYELQLSGDMLNYCYVSDSGVKYQGQLLSSPV